MALKLVTAMQVERLEWGENYRPLGRQAAGRNHRRPPGGGGGCWLDALSVDEQPDRRNGHNRRNLLAELGAIELAVPRSRRYCPSEVLRAHARRSVEIDRANLAGFVLGLSARKVVEQLIKAVAYQGVF